MESLSLHSQNAAESPKDSEVAIGSSPVDAGRSSWRSLANGTRPSWTPGTEKDREDLWSSGALFIIGSLKVAGRTEELQLEGR